MEYDIRELLETFRSGVVIVGGEFVKGGVRRTPRTPLVTGLDSNRYLKKLPKKSSEIARPQLAFGTGFPVCDCIYIATRYFFNVLI